jgi:hypothetical protein
MSRSFEATVDAIEGGLARLELADGESFTLPARLLPQGTKEGDRLAVTVARDEAGTERARARIASRRTALTRGDDGGDIEL